MLIYLNSYQEPLAPKNNSIYIVVFGRLLLARFKDNET